MNNTTFGLIILFFVLQLVNVILNTLKTLIMAKTDNKHLSAIINAVTFGFYVLVVQQIGKLDLTVTVPVTVVTNIIGVYLSYIIMGKARKDDLWKVEIYCPLSQYGSANFIWQKLKKANVPCRMDNPNDDFVTAYCYTQAQSETTNKIIKEYDAKYNITVITKKF